MRRDEDDSRGTEEKSGSGDLEPEPASIIRGRIQRPPSEEDVADIIRAFFSLSPDQEASASKGAEAKQRKEMRRLLLEKDPELEGLVEEQLVSAVEDLIGTEEEGQESERIRLWKGMVRAQALLELAEEDEKEQRKRELSNAISETVERTLFGKGERKNGTARRELRDRLEKFVSGKAVAAVAIERERVLREKEVLNKLEELYGIAGEAKKDEAERVFEGVGERIKLVARELSVAVASDQSEEISRLIEKSVQRGLGEEEIIKAAEAALRVAKTLGRKGDSVELLALKIIELRKKIKEKREAEKTRIEERKRREQEAQRLRQQLEKDLGRSVLEDDFQGSLSDLKRLVYLLSEQLRAPEGSFSARERVELEKKLNKARKICEDYARGLVKRDSEVASAYLSFVQELQKLKGRVNSVANKVRVGTVGYQDDIFLINSEIGRLLEGAFSFLRDDKIDSEVLAAFDFVLRTEVDALLRPIDEALSRIDFPSDPVEQRLWLTKWLDSISILGQSPDALYSSGAWSRTMAMLQDTERVHPSVRAEFRARMELLQLRSEMSSPDMGLESFLKIFPARITPARLKTLEEVEELVEATCVWQILAYEEEKSKNPLSSVTAEERKASLEYAAQVLRKRMESRLRKKKTELENQRETTRRRRGEKRDREIKEIERNLRFVEARLAEWSLEGKNEVQKAIVYERAEAYLQEIFPVYFALYGSQLPQADRRWWWFQRIVARYWERATRDGEGNPYVAERMFGPKLLVLVEGRWVPAWTKTDENGSPFDERGEVKHQRVPIGWGLPAPIEVALAGVKLEKLADLGFDCQNPERKKVMTMGRVRGGRGELVLGGREIECLVLKRRAEDGRLPMEIWLTTTKNESGEEVIAAALNIVNFDPKILFEMGVIKESAFGSYFSKVGEVEKIRKAWEELGALRFPPESIDVKAFVEEISRYIKTFIDSWGGHLPSIAQEVARAKRLALDRGESLERITEEVIRKPGVLYQEDIAANFVETWTLLYLGKIDPEIYQRSPRLSWSPNMYASEVLRAASVGGLITVAQERELERRVWGTIPLGPIEIRMRALAERSDAILYQWRGPQRTFLLMGWFFYFLKQLFTASGLSFEKK